jgi:phage terminase small subunit
MKAPPPPKDLKAPGRKIWRELQAAYEFEVHEAALLHEYCRSIDTLHELAAIVEREGVMDPETVRVHPAVVEQRQMRIVAARLAAALRLPSGDKEEGKAGDGLRRPQRRVGVRGIYSIEGGRTA